MRSSLFVNVEIAALAAIWVPQPTRRAETALPRFFNSVKTSQSAETCRLLFLRQG